jgi:hypothetical protein
MLQDIPPELSKALGPLALVFWIGVGAIKLYKSLKGENGKKVEEVFNSKALAQQTDVVIAANFIQFKDDIRAIVKEQGEANQKDYRNALTDLALDLELFESSPARVRRRRKRNR